MADLQDFIAAVEGQRKHLTVYAPPSKAALANELKAYFDSQNVDITFCSDEGTTPRAELADEGGTPLVSVDIESLETLVSGGTAPLDRGQRPYAPLLAHLDETTFGPYDRQQMVHVSREIEDRAWRERGGRLCAGFQRLSNVAEQSDVYRTLAGAGIDVDVYGVADHDFADAPFRVHPAAETGADVAGTWFVAFDGGGRDEQKCVLLAEERDDGFRGFWSYNPSIVDAVIATLDGEDVGTETVRRAVG